FDWSDLGTWGSLYDELPKDENNNVMVNGSLMAKDATGNIVRSNPGKIVVIDSLCDYIIVDKEEVLLIFPKEKEQDIKTLQQQVKETFGEKYV
ncbi:MAG: mannose-1-phosphate guanylyltransferase, partial [Mangrovimonas sp.]|nr:mannose-1-phosphate guanylyltransferase [Mangrovimonas sp.]